MSSAHSNYQGQPFVMGIDLGGTKMAIGVVTLNLELLDCIHLPTFPPDETLMTTPNQRERFIERMGKAIYDLILQWEKKGAIFSGKVGLGSPGNILNGTIKANTTPQLGPIMDDYNIEEGLAEALKKISYKAITVVARNDALAQMAYSLAELFKVEEYRQILGGNRVAYVGPGTGLGGGFAWIRTNQEKMELEFFTDGHIGDIIMGYDAQTHAPVWAEFDYLSGIFIAKRTNGLTGKDLARDLDSHRSFVQELGRNLGMIIEKIYRGEVYKARETTMWNDHDRLQVKGIRHFIIGGSIGTRGEMGTIIRQEAINYLNHQITGHGIELIPVLSDCADAGVLGAAQFVMS